MRRPEGGGPLGHLTWPWNPQKKTKKNKNKNREKKKHSQKWAFSIINQNFLFWVGVQNFLLWQLGPKSAHPKNTIKIWVSAFFRWKKICVTKRPFLNQKNPNPEIPAIILFCRFLLSQWQNTQKLLKNPYFYSDLENLKKKNFKV